MLTSAQLAAYLERIGLSRPRRPTPDALVRVHRAHIDAIPYENIDVQLGRPIRLDDDALFDKLVARRRGGFCYEQNGLLALALETLGYRVRRMRGGVDRARRGEQVWYNHLPLLVEHSGGDHLVDAGLGVGFRDPLPLREGSVRVGPFNFGLWEMEPGLWRCTLDPRVEDLSFDFTLQPREIGEFAEKCLELETSPESGFVKTLTVQRPGEASTTVLRARSLSVFDPALPEGKTVRGVEAFDDFAELLSGDFGLSLSAADLDVLWRRTGEQHRRWVAEQAEKARSANAK